MFVLTVVVRCPALMEDCRRLFETKLQIQFGPIASFTEKHLHQNMSPPLNIVNYIKVWPLKARFFKKCVEKWELNTHVCCTATHGGSLVGVYCLVCPNYGKKYMLSLKKKIMSMPNTLWKQTF